MIGVFDSGIGGLHVLKKLEIEFPGLDFIYYADSNNYPYGSKSKEEIFACVSKIIDFFDSAGVDLIVCACNTASFVIDEFLPNNDFITTLPSIDRFAHIDDLIVFSTKLSALYLEKRKAFVNSKIVPLEKLSEMIEKNDPEIENYLSFYLADVKNVLLACTHFPIIIDQFKKINSNANFFDPADDIVSRVKSRYSKVGSFKRFFFPSGLDKTFASLF